MSQLKHINPSAFSVLHGPSLASARDYWINQQSAPKEHKSLDSFHPTKLPTPVERSASVLYSTLATYGYQTLEMPDHVTKELNFSFLNFSCS